MNGQTGNQVSIMDVFEEEAVYHSFDRSASEEIFKSIYQLHTAGLDLAERRLKEDELNNVGLKGLQALYLAPVVYKGKINAKALDLVKSNLKRLALEHQGARQYLFAVGYLENPDTAWKSEILNILVEIDKFEDDFPNGIDHMLDSSKSLDISVLPVLFKFKQNQGSDLNTQAFEIVRKHIQDAAGIDDYVSQAYSSGLSVLLAADSFPSHQIAQLVELFIKHLRRAPSGSPFHETETELKKFDPGIISTSSLEGIIYGCDAVISNDKSPSNKTYLRMFLARCIHAYGEEHGSNYFSEVVALINGMHGLDNLTYSFCSNGILSSNRSCSNIHFFKGGSGYLEGLKNLFDSNTVNTEMIEPLAIQVLFATNSNAPGGLKKVMSDWFDTLPSGIRYRAEEAHKRISGGGIDRGRGGRGRERGGRDLA